MKSLWALPAACAALILTASDPLNLLPYAREIDTVALIRTLGVDAGEDGLEVTLSSGAADGGLPTLLRGQGGTVSGALLSLQGTGTAGLFYGHVGQLLLGEELARQGTRPVLDYVLRDVEMRLDTDLYLISGGTAEAAIRTSAGIGASAAERLEAMAADSALRSDTMVRTVGDVLSDSEEWGAALVPALRLGDRGPEAAGYGILREGALAGWAEGETARGINLYMGQTDADLLELGGAALRVVAAKSRVRPLIQNGKFAGVEVLCRVQANLAEGAPETDGRRPPDHLLRQLELREQQRLSRALELVRSLDADYLGLKQAAELAAPWRKEEISRHWEPERLQLIARVEGHIERSYDAL